MFLFAFASWIATTPVVNAGAEGILIQGTTLTQGALDPVIVFRDGEAFDTSALRLAVSTVAYDDADLILYDRATGGVHTVDVAESAIAARHLISPTEPATTLGALFSEPGVVLRFETSEPATAADPDLADAFDVYFPNAPAALYLRALDSLPAVAPGCACGDVTLNGSIDSADVSLIRGALADVAGSPLSTAAMACCSVVGPGSGCDIADIVVLRRSLVPLPPPRQPVCGAVNP